MARLWPIASGAAGARPALAETTAPGEFEIGRFRRHLALVTKAATLAALNEHIAAADLLDDTSVITGPVTSGKRSRRHEGAREIQPDGRPRRQVRLGTSDRRAFGGVQGERKEPWRPQGGGIEGELTRDRHHGLDITAWTSRPGNHGGVGHRPAGP
jgi:hypothetical protein